MVAAIIYAVADAYVISKVLTCFGIDVTGELPGFSAVGAGKPAFYARVLLQSILWEIH